ncbi:MAG: IS3 family transposase, partial [bacterium]|nr:IS3 family transposase [bacterium]
RTTFHNRREARNAVFHWIEAWYNLNRRHSSIGRVSPANFERRNLYKHDTGNANLSGLPG